MTMTTIKTQDLTGPALDWAVAIAQGLALAGAAEDGHIQWRKPGTLLGFSFEPSTNPAQGLPIIEREMLGVMPVSDAWWRAADVDGANGFGPTILIAGMRCYVVSKLGLIVDVPAELITTP